MAYTAISEFEEDRNSDTLQKLSWMLARSGQHERTSVGTWQENGELRGIHAIPHLSTYVPHQLKRDPYRHGLSFFSDSTRGDSVLTPFYAEESGLYGLFELTFHKGDSYCEIVYFPAASEDMRDTVGALLSDVERRD